MPESVNELVKGVSAQRSFSPSYVILPTYIKRRNVTVRDYRHNANGVRYTRGDAARYETTEGDIGPRI